MCHLPWITLPWARVPLAVVAARDGGSGLLIAAVGHAKLLEHDLAHEQRERLARHVHHELLLDCHATTRIAYPRAGNEIHPDRRRVSWLLAIENLHQRRHWLVRSE